MLWPPPCGVIYVTRSLIPIWWISLELDSSQSPSYSWDRWVYLNKRTEEFVVIAIQIYAMVVKIYYRPKCLSTVINLTDVHIWLSLFIRSPSFHFLPWLRFALPLLSFTALDLQPFLFQALEWHTGRLSLTDFQIILALMPSFPLCGKLKLWHNISIKIVIAKMAYNSQYTLWNWFWWIFVT